MSAARFPGDVDVNKVAIVGASGYFDITKLTIGIDVYENIFFPFVRGIITVDDAQDTINKINLILQACHQIIFSRSCMDENMKRMKKNGK